MGEKLLKYYKYIAEKKGIVGKIELAKQTTMPSTLAAIEPDTEDNVRLFRESVQQITGKPAPNL